MRWLNESDALSIRQDLGGLINLLAMGATQGFLNSVGGTVPQGVLAAMDEFGTLLARTPLEARESVAIEPWGKDEGAADAVMPLWTKVGPTGRGIRFRVRRNTLTGYWIYSVIGVETLSPTPTPTPPFETYRAPERPVSNESAIDRPLAEDPVPVRWRPILKHLVDRLVAGDYAGLAADGLVWFTDDPTDDSVGDFIEMYPDTLIAMPADGWIYSEHHYNAQDDGSWSAYVPLWTTNESPSDLTMEAVVWDDGTTVSAKISMVHTM